MEKVLKKKIPPVDNQIEIEKFLKKNFYPSWTQFKVEKRVEKILKKKFPPVGNQIEIEKILRNCWTDFEEEVSPQLDPNWSWKDFEKILKGFWNYFEISWNDYWTDFEGKVFSLFGNQIEVKNKILKRFWRKVPPKLATKLKLTGVSRPDGEMASADVCLEINPGKEKRNRSRKGKKK